MEPLKSGDLCDWTEVGMEASRSTEKNITFIDVGGRGKVRLTEGMGGS